ncbi:MAG: hypothetical protein S4CHLAM6_09080 [Chlamydiae bacterium]|nr:hypothetical protein [Chlamydiota bacterium]
MTSIQENFNNGSINASPKPVSSEFGQHMDKVDYLLGFLEPSSRAPGLIGMISWASLKEGLLVEQNYFTDKVNSGALSLRETDSANDALAKISTALEKIS